LFHLLFISLLISCLYAKTGRVCEEYLAGYAGNTGGEEREGSLQSFKYPRFLLSATFGGHVTVLFGDAIFTFLSSP